MVLCATLGFMASALFGTGKGVPGGFICEGGKKACGSAATSEQQLEGNCGYLGRELLPVGAVVQRQAIPDSGSTALAVAGM
jgi:hypothetical protein